MQFLLQKEDKVDISSQDSHEMTTLVCAAQIMSHTVLRQHSLLTTEAKTCIRIRQSHSDNVVTSGRQRKSSYAALSGAVSSSEGRCRRST